MKAARWLALSGSVGLAVAFAAAIPATAASAHSSAAAGRVPLAGSLAPKQERSHPAGKVAAGAEVNFDLTLKLRNAAGAKAFVKAVSDPGSREFHHYLTDKKWTSKFGPTRSSVRKAEGWLRHSGFKISSLAKDRLLISARGTARQVEKAFGVTLSYYMVNGHKVRLADGTLSIPASLSSAVSGTVGVNEYLASNELSQRLSAPAGQAAKANQEPGPPAGFRNPQPCSKYWGQKIDTTDSTSLYSPYSGPLPYDICGYTPSQLRSAYNLTGKINKGDDGNGVAIAIVDAYDSPTLLSDAQEYFTRNDPSHPLTNAQFTNIEPTSVDDQAECGGSGWYPEQALDVESSHTMAPGADIIFVGAQDCTDASLLAALQVAITSGASVVSDSWGDTLGDLFTDAATHTAYDDTFMMADATGVSVLFSSGDDGDNFGISGLAVPNYPATSPYITAVGGTSLEIGKHGQRKAEYGWSTAHQTLCESTTTNCGSATTPAGSLGWDYGGGGGTSYYYTEPYYQANVVPSALALRNAPLFGDVPLRVVPDISMDADPQTGFLIGLTQTFPNGTYYDQFKEGGTSLASPLLAGVIADADQAAGTPLGFLNPVLYKAYTEKPSAFFDVQEPANPDAAAVIRVDYADSVDSAEGYVISLRTLNYEGPETYCDGTGNCATRDVTLTTAPGFDSMTGLGSAARGFIAELAKF